MAIIGPNPTHTHPHVIYIRKLLKLSPKTTFVLCVFGRHKPPSPPKINYIANTTHNLNFQDADQRNFQIYHAEEEIC